MSNNLYAFSPVANFFRMLPKGQYGLTFDGVTYEPGGDYQNAQLATETEKTPIYSNETPEPVLAMTHFGQTTSTITVEARMIPKAFLAIAYKAANGVAMNQDAAPDQVYLLEAMPAGGRRRYLPHGDVTIDTVTADDAEGDPIAYVKNVNYRIHKKTGLIEITKHPEGVVVDVNGKANITVNYDAAAIVDRPLYGLNSNLNVTAGFQWIGVGRYGPQAHMRAWICEAEFENIQLGQDGNEFATANLTLTIVPDPTREAGQEYALIEDITDYPAE